MITTTAHTCTVRNAVTGACGKPAVYTFTGSGGEAFGECAEHYTGPVVAASTGPKIGDAVTVHRHGKAYRAVVTRVTRTGAVYAHVVYDNGAEREVRVSA